MYYRVMTVTGISNLSVEPDVAEVQLEVVTEGMELSQVQQENANTMNQVIQALLQLGIARQNIQTTTYTINPKYDYVDGTQVFRGYEVTNAITVKVEMIDQAGIVIDTAVQNGINRVLNIQFTVKDKNIYYKQALSSALKDAYAKAQTLAETMQIGIAPYPIKITEKTSEAPIAYKAYATMEAVTPIEPGQIVISATVEAQFQY
ncbi:SIMPL domain-containing protein [Virgibacillus sp. L01]|uniref:SIMPL domain-containing protein n=1 Tax=Virgibacillus sp. L01 TaxID=3457429 RepID=UPI003FD0FEDE